MCEQGHKAKNSVLKSAKRHNKKISGYTKSLRLDKE